ncbi:hypothetical protein HO133_010469 [Letharia lupina]|uniref:Protein kinase domain-containing protein n=1 Tax=Letharia lupina TaxID=560253 RepID=A0A8H6CKM2_9LECA|nr:uncharacterized protein HO133_010469 [Letharia lupina]KAF6225272.1 hypothetical protein HO133_010469 [Letharia lupina]
MELPAMNSRNDLISFLAVAQYYEIDIVSLTWQQGRGQLGIGGTSEIWQANYSKRMDFVFKRMKFADTDEEKGFNALVSEISILSHPLIRHHQNIVKLEGIGWDIPQQSHKVWPVLILEKAQLGDLRSFMCSEQGRSTTMRERLELCTDVASAIIAMHSNYMSHGDIKPENVLIHKDGIGELHAKLADFGYAGWAIKKMEDVLIKPPRSRPWDPPEYHHRGFTVLGARKLDVYSFGMLCLWVLFFDRPLDSDYVPTAIRKTQLCTFHDPKLLDSMKHEGTLGDFAGGLVRSVASLPAKQRENLERFFLSALARDPAKRTMKFEDLASLLGPGWQPGPATLDTDQMEIDHSSIKVEIAKTFYSLMRAHPRVRSHIFECIHDQAQGGLFEKHRLNAAFQLAFCYKTGFGTPSNDELSQIWVKRAQRCAQDLDEEVELAKGTMNRGNYRNGDFQSLAYSGLLSEASPIIRPKDDELTIAMADCKREIRDMELAFGKHNCSVLELKLNQASRMEAAGKYKEAESLRVGLLQDLRDEPGSLQLSVLAASTSAWRTLEVGRWRNHEGPRKPPLQLETSDSEEPAVLIDIMACLNDRIPETAQLLFHLGVNYAGQGRWQEAKWIFLRLTQTRMEMLGESHPTTLVLTTRLASTYSHLGQLSEAERIYIHISDIYTWVLGENHRDTLSTKAFLADVYVEQGRLDKAETLITKVHEAQQEVLGKEDFRTYDSMEVLAGVYLSQGHYNASEALRRQVIDFYKGSLGPDHPVTLFAMSQLSVTLAKQECWPEVKKITMQVLERRKELLGPGHPQTLTSIDNLATVHARQGLLREAETGFLDVIKGQNKIFGESSSRSLDAIQNLATLYGMQGRLKEEEALLMKLIERRKDCLGEEHPSSLISIERLAWNLLCQSRPREAERLYLRAVFLGRRVRGGKHPDQLLSESGLAETYLKQLRFQEAEKIILHVLEHIDAVLGADHPETMVARVRLARILNGQRRWRESDPIFLEAVEQRKKVMGDEDEMTLRVMRFYAWSLWSQGRWREAIPGLYRSSRGVCAARAFARRRSWGLTQGLRVSLVVAITAITYRWSKSFPGWAFAS